MPDFSSTRALREAGIPLRRRITLGRDSVDDTAVVSSYGKSWRASEFEEFANSHGGIVTRGELLGAGWTPDDLRIALGWYRRLHRLRRGWYCSSVVPTDIRAAWAHGGPLACVSALQWHGVLEPAAEIATLHVCLPRNAQRPLIDACPPRDVTLHWHDAVREPEARWAVPLEVARQQARFCTR